jgi:hypothetical protein
MELNSYELSRAFFDWSFDNPEKVKPIHAAIYFFSIEHCNRLGWKKSFGLPSQMVMEAIGVKNWRTYSAGLNDLVEFGFIKMIEISRNQYSSNIVAIVKNTKAHTKALDKALQKHSTKHGQSTVSIDKQYNKEQYNKEQTIQEDRHSLLVWLDKYAERVQQMKNPITNQQAEKIANEFEPESVADIFKSMHNNIQLHKKYVDANLTFRSWLNMRRKTNPNFGVKKTEANKFKTDGQQLYDYVQQKIKERENKDQ